jgi:hypothetical protein
MLIYRAAGRFGCNDGLRGVPGVTDEAVGLDPQ